MELAKSTIQTALIRRGYSDTHFNMMTVQDALQLEDRGNYATLDDCLDSVIADQEPILNKRKDKSKGGRLFCVDYEAKREQLYADYKAKVKLLDDDYEAKLKPLHDDYDAKLKLLEDDYEAKWKSLDDDYAAL